jgi:hypothetical protein
MTNKVRLGDSFGLDLTQVIGWKRVLPKNLISQNIIEVGIPLDSWNLEVYTHGNTITFYKGEAGFDYILKTLCEECGFELPKDTF